MVKHFGAFLLYHHNFGSNSQSSHEDGELLSLSGTKISLVRRSFTGIKSLDVYGPE